MLPVIHRLNKNFEIKRVLEKGFKIKGETLSLVVKKNSLNRTRISIIVSQKLIPKSTARNQMKRIIRADVFSLLSKLTKGYDIVILLNKKEEDHAEITKELIFLLKNSKLLND